MTFRKKQQENRIGFRYLNQVFTNIFKEKVIRFEGRNWGRIYKRKILEEELRKHALAFDQVKIRLKKKKARKNANDQEKRKKPRSRPRYRPGKKQDVYLFLL